MQKQDLKVVYRAVSELIPYARNARTHSDEQIERIANSIKEFGWTNPILIDGENGIIAGHGRILAARKLGIEKVPTIELSGLTEAQKRAYIIADNRLALDAGWDEEMLKLEFAELEKEGFELSKTGFSDEEINEMMADLDREVDGVEDVETPEPPKNPKTKRGEVWILGTHRLMCGDSTSVEDVQEVMGGGNSRSVAH
ncbi:MAG TPA: ParB N-terminal domain-containing protein [Candidatus Aphodousia faecalis]|nr:ParB N-terminal domain-containing protein [Candidatus Aphodousia faecalis]